MSETITHRVGITMGDPAGVGPELCLQALERGTINGVVPVVFGDADVLHRVAEVLGKPTPIRIVDLDDWAINYENQTEPCVIDMQAIDADAISPGVVSAETGRAAFTYIKTAIATTFMRQVCGVATAPINKEALHAAGVDFPGHTEIFADKCHIKSYCMMLTSKPITCTLATLHVRYSEVLDHLTTERILEVIELTHGAVAKMKGGKPRLTVLGLNPHAGENGLFGDEEQRIIQPAVDAAREKGIQVTNPISPDTAFVPDRMKTTDAYVCMYHDQGLIPVKMAAFDEAVNVTLGLPIVRTSVDHGTALDIAWQGKASPQSLFNAIDLAAKLYEPVRQL